MKRDRLILGVGNPLRQDDGVGPEVIKQLSKVNPRIDADILDGGTDGLGLIEVLGQYEKVVIIDAVEMKKKPGTVELFKPRQIKFAPARDSLSSHGFGLAEILSLLTTLEIDTDISIIGVQPKCIGFGEELSHEVASMLEQIKGIVMEQFR